MADWWEQPLQWLHCLLDNADMDVLFHFAGEGTPETDVGALHSDNWVMEALHGITEHTRHSIVLPAESGSSRHR
jgi:hypothetical protein